jgi:hypothetical protein
MVRVAQRKDAKLSVPVEMLTIACTENSALVESARLAEGVRAPTPLALKESLHSLGKRLLRRVRHLPSKHRKFHSNFQRHPLCMRKKWTMESLTCTRMTSIQSNTA